MKRNSYPRKTYLLFIAITISYTFQSGVLAGIKHINKNVDTSEASSNVQLLKDAEEIANDETSPENNEEEKNSDAASTEEQKPTADSSSETPKEDSVDKPVSKSDKFATEVEKKTPQEIDTLIKDLEDLSKKQSDPKMQKRLEALVEKAKKIQKSKTAKAYEGEQIPKVEPLRSITSAQLQDPAYMQNLEEKYPGISEKLKDPNRQTAFMAGERIFAPAGRDGEIRAYSKEDYQKLLEHAYSQFNEGANKLNDHIEERSGVWNSWKRYKEGMQEGLNGGAMETERAGYQAMMDRSVRTLKEAGVSADELAKLHDVRQSLNYATGQYLSSTHKDLIRVPVAGLVTAALAPIIAVKVAAAAPVLVAKASIAATEASMVTPLTVTSAATLGAGFVAARQVAENVSGVRSGYSQSEIVDGAAIGVAMAPVSQISGATKILAAVGAGLSGASAREEFEKGNYAVGAFDVATGLALPLVMSRAANPNSPLSPNIKPTITTPLATAKQRIVITDVVPSKDAAVLTIGEQLGHASLRSGGLRSNTKMPGYRSEVSTSPKEFTGLHIELPPELQPRLTAGIKATEGKMAAGCTNGVCNAIDAAGFEIVGLNRVPGVPVTTRDLANAVLRNGLREKATGIVHPVENVYTSGAKTVQGVLNRGDEVQMPLIGALGVGVGWTLQNAAEGSNEKQTERQKQAPPPPKRAALPKVNLIPQFQVIPLAEDVD